MQPTRGQQARLFAPVRDHRTGTETATPASVFMAPGNVGVDVFCAFGHVRVS